MSELCWLLWIKLGKISNSNNFQNPKILLSFCNLTLNFCMWSQYLFRFKSNIASQTTFKLIPPPNFSTFFKYQTWEGQNVDFEIRYPTLRGPYLGQILIDFQNQGHFWNQNFIGFSKRAKIFILGALEAEKLQKTKCLKY